MCKHGCISDWKWYGGEMVQLFFKNILYGVTRLEKIRNESLQQT